MAEIFDRGVVVVTGGTGLIGLAVARAFLDAGARVAVIGSTAARCEAAERELAVGHRLRAITADVSDAGALDGALATIERDLGDVSVLVNGAGINFNRMIADVSGQEFDRLIAVNVKAAFMASRRVCEAMKAAGRAGRVVNVTSGNYRYTRPDGALYSASKAALEMLTRAFALEYGEHGITVNAVAPGLVERPGQTDAAFLRVAKYYAANSPIGRLTRPAEVAEAVLYLASEKAAAVTGETIVMDGGFSAGRFDFPRRS